MNQSPEDAVGPHSELLLGLASQLRRRNVEQSVAFKDVFNAHQGLLHVNEKLRQQTLEQDKDIIILRHKLTEGLSHGESSEALRSMQDELQRMQVQVSDKYRSSAEAASEQLRLMKEAQLLQDRLRQSTSRLEKLHDEHGNTMSRYATLQDSHALLESALATQRAETESLRNLLGGREAEAVSIREQARTEREELVSRLLEDKGSMLEEMNKMNEENTALRAEKKTLTSRIQRSNAAHTRSSPSSATMGGDHERSEAGIPPAWMAPQQLGEGREDRLSSSSGRHPASSGTVPSRCFQAIEAHSSSINDVVFGREGGLLATAGDDSYVKIWDAGSGRQKALLKGAAHKGVSVMMAVDIHGDLVCGGGSDGSCMVWSIKTCREKARLTGHQQKVCGVAFCNGGRRLITGSQDCSIKAWDLHRGNWDATTNVMRATSKCNAIDASQSWRDSSGSNAVVVSGHMDGVVRLWDMRTGNCAHQLKGLHTDQVTSVKFASGRGHLLLTNSRDSSLKVIDARMNQTVASLTHPGYHTATSFSRACLSPSAAFAAGASTDGNVYIWDIARSTPATAATTVETQAATMESQAVTSSPAEPSTVTAVMSSHGTAAIACDWSLNMPNTLASCDSGGGLRVWA